MNEKKIEELEKKLNETREILDELVYHFMLRFGDGLSSVEGVSEVGRMTESDKHIKKETFRKSFIDVKDYGVEHVQEMIEDRHPWLFINTKSDCLWSIFEVIKKKKAKQFKKEFREYAEKRQ